MLPCLDHGLPVLLGGFLIHLVLGTVYLWGSINVYITSYLRLQGSSVTLADLFFVLPLSILMISSFSSLGPYLLKYLNPKAILLIGGSLIFSGYFSSSYVSNPFLFVFLYGALPGIGSGVCYLVPVNCAWEYYPARKGLVAGVIIGGFGLSAFLFSFVVQALFNPSNFTLEASGYFGELVASRAMSGIRVLAIVWGALFLLGVLLVRMPEISLYKYYKRDNVYQMA